MMVGAQLWPLRSTVARKAEYGNGVDSPSRIMAGAVASQDGGLASPKPRSKGTLEMVRGSEPGLRR